MAADRNRKYSALASCLTALEIWPDDEALQRTFARCRTAQQRGQVNRPAMQPRHLLQRVVILGAASLFLFYFVGLPLLAAFFDRPVSAWDSPNFVRGEYTADELHLVLDENGRPYDIASPEYWPERVELQQLAEWTVPDGRLLSMDGTWIHIGPTQVAEHSPKLEFSSEELQLSSIAAWWPQTDGGEPYKGSIGIEVRVPGTRVATWGPTEFGAGTDAGIIGMVTEASFALDGTDGEFISYDQMGDWWDSGSAVATFEVGDGGSFDAVLLSTGGDGGFPLVRGYDEDGQFVAALLLTLDYPWRLTITEGTMPPDLAAKEEQLIECMAGERDVRVHDMGEGRTVLACEINVDELPSAEDFTPGE